MRRIAALVCALALWGAACGSPAPQIESTTLVAEVLEAAAQEPVTTTEAAAQTPVTTTEAPSPTVPPGCWLAVEIDEYGFEVEVVVCDEPRDPVPEDPDWLGSRNARLAATMLREAMIGQEQCGKLASYGELKTLIAEAAAEFREPLLAATAALEQGSAFCNNDKDAWAASMIEAIGYLDEFLRAVETSGIAAAPDETVDQ